MDVAKYMEVQKAPSQPQSGWAAPRGNPEECTTWIVQSETLQGYKLAARLREVLIELGEPYVMSEGKTTMYLWIRPGVWEVFESYFKPGAFRFAGLDLTDYMRAMLR